jgi:5'/3'-nucleotidase SurE
VTRFGVLNQRTVISVVAAWAVAAALSAQSSPTPLRIVLTNDDGYQAAGLEAMRKALVAAGHSVSVVAPFEDHSGSGASMTTGTLKVESKGDGVWAVHGTPADSALVAVRHLFREHPPDLVVSGINRGQNLGTSSNSSGTVGAAIIAAQSGVPALAVSAGLVPGERPPAAAALLAQAYQNAAQVTTDVVALLAASRQAGGRLLPDRIVVNINCPAPASGALAGIRFAALSRRGSFAREFQSTSTPDQLRATLVAMPPAADEGDTDLALFARGYVTLTVLDGDWSATSAAGDLTATRLKAVTLPRAEKR